MFINLYGGTCTLYLLNTKCTLRGCLSLKHASGYPTMEHLLNVTLKLQAMFCGILQSGYTEIMSSLNPIR